MSRLDQLRERIRKGQDLVADKGNIRSQNETRPDEGIRVKPHTWGK